MESFKRKTGTAAETAKVKNGRHTVPLLILKPKDQKVPAPGILWIHGGGYILGMKEMAYLSRASYLVEQYGAVVVSPGYRMAFQSPYPAAIEDCYAALRYLKEHAAELGVRTDQIMVGGESAGGGLTAALCMLARDRDEIQIAFQMPLYPMLDNFDTESSADNHGKVWNTKRNHFGWKCYLRKKAHEAVSPYASPARQQDYTGLPPAYTFVGSREPFYTETLTYIENLRSAGIDAHVDIYDSDVHAFDLMRPEWEISRDAKRKFESAYRYAAEHYFAPQSTGKA